MKRALAFLLCLFLLSPAFPAPAEMFETETVDSFGEIHTLFFIHCFILGEDSLKFYTSPRFTNEVGTEFLRKGIRKVIARWCNEGASLELERRQVGGKTVRITGIRVRPGIRMAEAYANGLTDRLTSVERDCLKKVAKVVEKLQRKYPPSSVELELAIYDYICDHLNYRTSDSASERDKLTSACYAFLNGEGNCQAYTDLFYLMTTMAGFEGYPISGDADGAHIWNTILISDKLVMVDVTFGDNGDEDYPPPYHYYFNFGLDRVGNHTWYKEVYDNEYLKKTDDKISFYSDQGDQFGTVVSDPKDAVRYCISRGKKGYSCSEILIRNKNCTAKEIVRVFTRSLNGTKYRNDKWNVCCIHRDEHTVLEFRWQTFGGKKLK